MTQTEPATISIPRTTLLAESLAAFGSRRELAVYCGASTPLELDARERETEALASGAAVHDLGWMRRVEVRGEDRFRWLSGMVTNMVSDLAANAGAWNLVLNAQGRIQGDLWVWRDGDNVELEIAADQFDKLLAHLNHFIIMDDVELVPLEDEAAMGLTGPLAGDVLAGVGLPLLDEMLTQAVAQWNGGEIRIRRSYGAIAPHYELWAAPSILQQLWSAVIHAGAAPVGFGSLDAFRIAEGMPLYGIDMAERDLPQETSQMRAISFNKGCYLGQEIVERIRSRGNVHRHLRQLELLGPAPAQGTELFPESIDTVPENAGARMDKPAGHITSAASLPLAGGSRTFALAMIRAEAETGGRALKYTSGSETGIARILSGPPNLTPESRGNKEP